MSDLNIYEICRAVYDGLDHKHTDIDTTKKLGIINGFLGADLVISLLFGSDRGDILILQMYGQTVRVFAEPAKWDHNEIEGATKTQVLAFLEGLKQRRANRRRTGLHRPQ